MSLVDHLEELRRKGAASMRLGLWTR